MLRIHNCDFYMCNFGKVKYPKYHQNSYEKLKDHSLIYIINFQVTAMIPIHMALFHYWRLFKRSCLSCSKVTFYALVLMLEDRAHAREILVVLSCTTNERITAGFSLQQFREQCVTVEITITQEFMSDLIIPSFCHLYCQQLERIVSFY